MNRKTKMIMWTLSFLMGLFFGLQPTFAQSTGQQGVTASGSDGQDNQCNIQNWVVSHTQVPAEATGEATTAPPQPGGVQGAQE